METPQNYICGPCGQKFTSDTDNTAVELYYAHVCPASGYQPTDSRNLGPQFEVISQAALERGAAEQPTVPAQVADPTPPVAPTV